MLEIVTQSLSCVFMSREYAGNLGEEEEEHEKKLEQEYLLNLVHKF